MTPHSLDSSGSTKMSGLHKPDWGTTGAETLQSSVVPNPFEIMWDDSNSTFFRKTVTNMFMGGGGGMAWKMVERGGGT